MRKTLLLLAALLPLAACTSTGGTAGPEPIPGSITYSGQPRTKLTKAPVGSTFTHRFRGGPYGLEYEEVYRIAPDRSLELLSRRQLRRFFDYND
ncbi:hypothetical protein [Rhizobium sp. CC-YZS058]|uniref:hypothetical protein n=1 Tax=Rhizobium sp. CC-YZS058 TaxID=3042153 RepID=UPI002B05A4A7|nr:hypothetical protein [Rhizobium sp. CC-YZS058]MEA3535632.1 hypothetical protein [Rhizobium sp. CC-YZS058]